MVAGTTGDHVNVPGLVQPLDELVHLRGPVQHIQQLPGHMALLVDLFEHEVWEAAFLGRFHAVFHDLRVAVDDRAVFHAGQFISPGPEADDLAVLQAEDLGSERQDRGQVGADADHILGDPGHQAGTHFDGIQPILAYFPDHKAVIPFQVLGGQTDGLHHLVALIHITFHCVHATFAVILGAHDHTLGPEFFHQLHVVDHIAVVSANQVAVRIQVGLGVDL